jgi:hypothetical protein
MKVLMAALAVLTCCSIRVLCQTSQPDLKSGANLPQQRIVNDARRMEPMGHGPKMPYFAPLPPKLSKEEKRRLSPSEQDKERFAEFLKQPKTGIVRLLPGDGCDESSGIVNASGPCAAHTIAKVMGGGAYYSFRVKSHQAEPWSDIRFADSSFRVGGKYRQALLSSLGDVPLDNVGPGFAGIRFVFDFVPATRKAELLKQTASISHGLSVDGFTYAYTQPVLDNTTYVLRSIAFDRKSRVNPMDKKIDIIVAFRVVRKDTDGSVVLLWKELARAKSPKLYY